MRTAIYGAGSLGTILGAYITKNGGQVDLINHNRAHIEALRRNGATVTGTVHFNQRVTALTPEQMNGRYDVIVAYGRKVGCPTPMNEKVVEVIHRIERGELRPGFGNLPLFG